jgi:hypothetical protein
MFDLNNISHNSVSAANVLNSSMPAIVEEEIVIKKLRLQKS